MVPFANLVRAIFHGKLASFAAQYNNHVCDCTAVLPPRLPDTPCIGYYQAAFYNCTSNKPLLRGLALDKWTHVQTLQLIAQDTLFIKDEMSWPHCTASRSYTVFLVVDEDKIVCATNKWKVTAASPWTTTQRPVTAALRRSLNALDSKVFNAFLDSLDLT